MSEKMYEKLKDNAYFPYFDVKKKHDMKDLSREECMQIFAKMRILHEICGSVIINYKLILRGKKYDK